MLFINMAKLLMFSKKMVTFAIIWLSVPFRDRIAEESSLARSLTNLLV